MKKITKSVLASCMTATLTSVVQAEQIVYEDSSGNLQYVEYVDSPATAEAAQIETHEQWQQVGQTDIPREQTIVYEEAQPPQPMSNSNGYDSYAYQEGGTDSYQQQDYQVYEQASLQQQSYEQAYEQAYQQPTAYAQAHEQAYEQPVQEQQVVYEQNPTPLQATAQLSPEVLGERLLTAARAGKLDDVRWLLRKGADPEFKLHANALSPLDLVIKGGWVDVAQVFLDGGVNFNKRGDLGMTFLHQAAAAGKLPMVKFLVSAGVSPNTTTTKDWTALHHAARFGHADVVSYLLTVGADAEHRNSDGFRPRELAINAQHLQIAQMF